jgi:tRNA 2-thiouridine synthesizing protein C
VISKRFLLVCRRPPYGAAFAREALDVALAAAAFEQRVALLFLGDGVLQLLPAQEAEALGQKPLDKQLGALPLYDVEELYVDAEALQARALDPAELALPAQPLGAAAIAALLAEQDVVLGF